MCGIAGIIQKEQKHFDLGTIEAMNKTLRHRGPDDEGYFCVDAKTRDFVLLGGDDTPKIIQESRLPYLPQENIKERSRERAAYSVMLANRRLAIIDLSYRGHQPMCSQDRRLWITYNGEIHNFKDIKQELERGGYQFTSESDTEVVLASYQKWGRQCLHRFNGMWAFAIWDAKERKLFASRDRYGIKPFYYFWDGETFLFASEIKALLAPEVISPRPNPAVMYSYLAFGETDYDEETFFADIKQLRGGHLMELDLEKGSVSVKRWYDIPFGHEAIHSDKEYAERLREIFEDSIRLRLISDVPVGTCLSGGLDSSSIVCVVDKLMREQGYKLPGGSIQKTFSARYDVKPHDEGEYIKEVINKTGVDAYATYPKPEGLLQEIETFVRAHDEPVGTTSMYAQWEVFKVAKTTGVTVTLDGQGGDETMGGYHHYFGPYFADLLRTMRLGEFLSEFTAYRTIHGYSGMQAMRQIAPNLLPVFLRQNLRPLRTPSWLNRSVFGKLPRRSSLPRAFEGSFDRQLYFDTIFLLHALLRFEDRNSMAHSIESRLPFLDHRLVEFSSSIPANAKIKHGTTKVVLRNAMKGILPDKVRLRQSKIGFSTPEDLWFRTSLKPWVRELLGSSSFTSRPYFRHKEIVESYERHAKGEVNLSHDIWRWINTELWLRAFMD